MSTDIKDSRRVDSAAFRRKETLKLLTILVPVLLIAGCAGPAGIRQRGPAGEPVKVTRIEGVPFYAQADNQCGPAALVMVLTWSGVPVRPADLTAQVFTPSLKGSLQSAMIAGARRHGRIAYLLKPVDDGSAHRSEQHLDALIDEVSAGHPVIVLQNLGLAWFPVWHYAVVIGIDPMENRIILHSGRTADKTTAAALFLRTWARSDYWAMVIPRPGTLPVSLDEAGCLRAVSATEPLGRWRVAAEGYRAIMDRWPDSPAAYVGLGVCHFESGDLGAAEAVFRQATARFPDSGVAWNNLAEVLLTRGRRPEALAAAARAVALGGPLKSRFRQTLDSIRRR